MLITGSKHSYVWLTAFVLVLLTGYATFSMRDSLKYSLWIDQAPEVEVEAEVKAEAAEVKAEAAEVKAEAEAEVKAEVEGEGEGEGEGKVEVKVEGDFPEKAVILGKMKSEDVSWVSSELPDWQHAIYYMDDPDDGTLHPPMNKGREAMAYLSFIIDHYDALPTSMVFVHAHLDGYPTAWHTDAPEFNNAKSIKSLKLDYVQEHGYANMRCIHVPGCPDEVQVLRNDETLHGEVAMREAWPYMFGGNLSDIPTILAQPCCSQFAVSRAQVLKRGRNEYQRYRQWLLDTAVDEDTSGRVFEYLWQVIFGREAVYCPPVHQCWCEQFGRC